MRIFYTARNKSGQIFVELKSVTMVLKSEDVILSGINVNLRLVFGHVIERFTRRTNLNECLEIANLI